MVRHETGSVASVRTTMKRVNENTSGSEGLTDMIVNGTTATGRGPGSDGAGGMTIGSPDVRTVEIDMKTMTKSTSGTGGGDIGNGAPREPALARRKMQTGEITTNADGGTGARQALVIGLVVLALRSELASVHPTLTGRLVRGKTHLSVRTLLHRRTHSAPGMLMKTKMGAKRKELLKAQKSLETNR